MDIVINIIIFSLVALFVWSRFKPVSGVQEITTNELKHKLAGKQNPIPQFIDVRTPAEFKGRSIKGFKNIPLFSLPQEAEKLSTEREVVVICQSGMRSKQACKLLKKQGFQSITNVKGGMSAW